MIEHNFQPNWNQSSFLQKNEGYVYHNLLDKRMKMKREFNINDLVRAADLRRTFSKRYTTEESYKVFEVEKPVFDTKLSYGIDNLPHIKLKPYWKRQNYHRKRMIVSWKA